MASQNTSQPSGGSPSEVMLQLTSGLSVASAVYAVVKLGIPDLIGDETKTAAELAEATGTHAPSLYRLLSMLTSIDLLTRNEDDRFALTPVGATLRKDVPGSLRAWALSQLDEEHYRAWGDILHTVKTGGTAFKHQFGMDVWQYRAQHLEQSQLFDESMANLIGMFNQALLESYDFSSIQNMVDIGGGNGSLLINILKHNPHMRSIVFDSPHVAEGANLRVAEAGLSDRCTSVGGDFFVSVPSGGDMYVLSRVIHDWDDEHSIAILKNCRRVMSPEHKLLLVERVIPSQIDSSSKSQSIMRSDLNMMVMVGGQERSEAQYAKLLNSAGFQIKRVIPTRSVMSIVEAVPF